MFLVSCCLNLSVSGNTTISNILRLDSGSLSTLKKKKHKANGEELSSLSGRTSGHSSTVSATGRLFTTSLLLEAEEGMPMFL